MAATNCAFAELRGNNCQVAALAYLARGFGSLRSDGSGGDGLGGDGQSGEG